MTRNGPESPAPYDFAGQLIAHEANAIAQRWDLDVERVRQILVQMATDYGGQPLPEASPFRDNLDNGLRFDPSLNEALAYLDPNDALTLFEQTRPVVVARRARLVAYLGDPSSPSYTTTGLADALEAALGHLKRNRPELLTTGYPRTGFAGSRWLDWHLTLLSPTKVPVSAFNVSAGVPPGDPSATRSLPPYRMAVLDEEGLLPITPGGDPLYDFAWSREPIRPLWSRNGALLIRSFEHPIPDDRCGYAEAALIPGMPGDFAEELEQGRLRFFETKRSVLLACVRYLRALDPQPLWPSVLEILTSALLWDDVQRYLALENLYWHAGIGQCVAPAYAIRAPDEVPGTLSRLLFLVGHVEKELRIGTFTHTLEGIKRNCTTWDSQGIESYFQVVGHPKLPDVDEALDAFWGLEEREHAFWDEFRRRVNVALEQDFSVEVTIRTRVRRQLVAQFEPQMRTFAEWQRAHLEATGTLPVLHLGQPAPSTPVERNVFRRDGTHWTLTYDGKSVHVKDGNGMRLIAHLLRHPRREFHVLELVSILDGGPAYPHESHGNLSAEALDELGLHVVDGSHGEPPLDARAKADYERRVAALRENLDETRELGDAERAAAIELEIDFIQKELSAAFGLGGRARPARTPAERARTRIRKLIEGARRQIADHHPGLGHHLRAIKTGAYCSYSPAPSNELDWLT